MKSTIIIGAAIAAIAGLTYRALTLGYDGALLATSFTIIGGLAGYQIAKIGGNKAKENPLD